MTQPPLPEWAPHEAVWIGFPSDPELWLEDLSAGRARSRGLRRGGPCRTARASRCGWSPPMTMPPQRRAQLAPFADGHRRAVRRHLAARHRADRPRQRARPRRAQGFRFNGWGGKYELEGDDSIGAAARRERPACPTPRPTGSSKAARSTATAPGTRRHHRAMPAQPQPQSRLTRDEVEARLQRDLGFERVLWLGEGLLNDHTDGHVDNLARFVAPGRVAIPNAGDGRSQRRGLSRRARSALRRPGSTSSPSPRPAGSSATARSSRPAT